MATSICIFAGVRLTKDPEAIETKTGTPMVRFSVAIPKGESAIYPDFKAFGAVAETVLAKCRKGTRITITNSHLDINTWTDNQGVTRKSHEYIVTDLVVEYTAPVVGESSSDILPTTQAGIDFSKITMGGAIGAPNQSPAQAYPPRKGAYQQNRPVATTATATNGWNPEQDPLFPNA